MRPYGKFRPTGFDTAGLALPDRQDWLVLGVGRNRDSGNLDQSNFAAALAILADGREDAEDFETHSFNHWACGWFEIILVQPGTRAAELAEEIESRLELYPVLDEEDNSRREWEDFCAGWESWGCRDFIDQLCDVFGLTDRTRDLLEDADKDVLREFWMRHAREPYFEESDGVNIPTRRTGDYFDRSDVARLVRDLRAAVA